MDEMKQDGPPQAAAADEADPPPLSKLAAARKAIQDFLIEQFQACAVRITKIAPHPDGAAGWYAEAEMLVPDLGIRTLGLPLSQEVLEKEYCAVDLDTAMAIVKFEMLEPRER